MNREEITEELFRLQDLSYAAFQAKLINTVDREKIIGVRTPALRSLSKKIAKDDANDFISSLPHYYFEENQLHAFLLYYIADFDECVSQVDAFLSFIDNWATCDQLSPKAFKKEPERLLPYINKWIISDKTYTVRFAIKLLMDHFLGDLFDIKQADFIASIRSDEYYIKMMIAWYFATALAKRYDQIIFYLENNRLDRRTHNKTIQKCVESFRITEEQKAYLKTLKIK